MLEVRGLDVTYGPLQALWHVSLAVSKGEVVALLGPNGAGKTSTMRAIAGMLRPAGGEILLGGQPVHGLPSHEIVARGLALVPEGRSVFTTMTVEENLEMGAYGRRARPHLSESMTRVFDVFPVLKERRRQLAGTLSGGEQQMLAIGRALMSRPEILLLDEPSLGVAPVMVRRTFDVLRELRAQGMTILVVEQSVGMALRLADRAYVLQAGRVVAEGPADRLQEDETVRTSYLGA